MQDVGREGIELIVLCGSSLSGFHKQVQVSHPFFNREYSVFCSQHSGTVVEMTQKIVSVDLE